MRPDVMEDERRNGNRSATILSYRYPKQCFQVFLHQTY